MFGFEYWWKTEYNREISIDWSHAYALYQRKDYVGAEARLRSYNEDWGDNYGKGHYYLALCLEHEGRLDEARAAFQEALHLSRPGSRYYGRPTQDRYYNIQQELKKLALTTPGDTGVASQTTALNTTKPTAKKPPFSPAPLTYPQQ